ncbi:beta-ketoacyl synthase N-terminal-like domain-containing protein [Kitasatospora sp. NPDC088391]|uniref:beta-ketoacyl synthase N-terminal-like domain-containing protein n=1 Tax=Kitasatospora sp. NPDC088391 TaxID=3364074 RepID=UPI0037FA5FEE
MAAPVDTRAIAVVGMTGRFPTAPDVAALAGLLAGGGTAVREFTPAELAAARVPAEVLPDPRYVPSGAPLEGVELFDADFFGMTDREADLTDPQQRLFLEGVWTALEEAGLGVAEQDGRIGVFGSAGPSTYLVNNLLRNPVTGAQGLNPALLLGNDADFVATRAVTRLGLSGPGTSVGEDGSLLAVHLACEALRAGECDIAVAGGAAVRVPQTAGHWAVDPATGRAFVPRGNACALVVLRRHAEAVAAGDRIHAVIRGTAIVEHPVGPGPAGLTRLLARAGLPAGGLGHLDVHSADGGPVDVARLTALVEVPGPARWRLGEGTAARLGHLGTAAGVTGLIASALLLRSHEQTAPGGEFADGAVDAALDAEFARDSGAAADPADPTGRTVAAGTEAERVPPPRGAGSAGRGVDAACVATLGAGSADVYCLLAPPPVRERAGAPAGSYLVPLSAVDRAGLRESARDLLRHLDRQPGLRVDDLVRTLAEARPELPHRVLLRAADTAGVRTALRDYLATGRSAEPGPPAGGWLTGGQVRAESFGDLRHARRTAVPARPLRRRRHWIEPAPEERAAPPPAAPPVPRPGLLRERTLRRLRPGTGGRDLFLIHPAGGSVFCYQNLLAHSHYPGTVWALSFPAARVDELTGVPALARAHLQEIRRVRPRGPYLLGGYSFGGTVAYEVARILQQEGEQVEHLLLMDALPPEAYPKPELAEFLSAVPEFGRSVLGLGQLPDGPAPTGFDEAVELLRQPGWNAETVAEYRVFLEVFWANCRALAKYRAGGSRLRVPATLIRAASPEPPEVFTRLGVRAETAERWPQRFEHPPRTVLVPGDHYTMVHHPAHRRALAAALDEALAEAN